MRFEKPNKKSGRPGFVDGRIAELQRQLATETKENRKSELLAEIKNGNETDRNQSVTRQMRRRSTVRLSYLAFFASLSRCFCFA